MSAALAHDHHLVPKYIYNHDIMDCTADCVVGNQLYSGRALAITEPWDTIQLHEDLQPLWQAITSHYQRVGLTHTRDVIWHLDLKQLGSHIGYQPSVFYFGPNEYDNWGDNEWLESVAFINSKNNFMALAHELGIDVPTTLCFHRAAQVDINAIKDMTYPCYLKAAISVSGAGIYRCTNKTELLINLAKFNIDVPVQIQQEIQADTFLNMQYKVVGNQLMRLAVSEQILDGFAHQGNRFPARYEPWESVDIMASWLKERGMKGIFAFDVAVVRTDNGVRFPAIECNPRFNGASYPTLIAQKLAIPEWSALNYTTKYRSLEEIDLGGIEFDKKTGEGAIIVNWGTVLAGKVMLLLAGSREHQDALNMELLARLC